MESVLILVAHPILEHSRVHRRLLQALAGMEQVTLHDLYQAYPDFYIDTGHEQDLLREHQHIVLQFPLYWFSTPSLLKEWQDLVLPQPGRSTSEPLELKGKTLGLAVSYSEPLPQFRDFGLPADPIAAMEAIFLPLRLTAKRAGLTWCKPFLIPEASHLDDTQLALAAEGYRDHLLAKVYHQRAVADQKSSERAALGDGGR